jgi:hypothetical protein
MFGVHKRQATGVSDERLLTSQDYLRLIEFDIACNPYWSLMFKRFLEAQNEFCPVYQKRLDCLH